MIFSAKIMCIAAGSRKAGSITGCFSKWEDIGTSSTVLSWIKEGVPLPFSGVPEKFEIKNGAFKAKEYRWIDGEISRLVEEGALQICDTAPDFVSPISVVPKKGGDYRLIVDLRQLNKHLSPPHFSNEDISSILKVIQPNEKLITIDIKSCFHHVPIAKEYQKYVCIKWRNTYYQ